MNRQLEQGLCGGSDFRVLAQRVLRPVATTQAELGFAPTPGALMTERPEHGDWELNPGLGAELTQRKTRRAAAVLIPVIERNELSVLLTRRSEHMTSHAGQISFPGGKVEDDDQDPVDTALRETHEEVGVVRAHIEPLGLLDGYQTGTGFDITPVVALLDPGFTLDVDQNEVAEVFEVPLRFLMDESRYEQHAWQWHGKTYHFHAISYREYYIWGATAGILKNLLERLSNR